MPLPDRVQRLLNQQIVTGIDFIYVADDQLTLDVYFLESASHSPASLEIPLVGNSDASLDLQAEQVRIYAPAGSQTLPEIILRAGGAQWWVWVEGATAPQPWAAGLANVTRHFWRLQVEQPGDFARYRLAIADNQGALPTDGGATIPVSRIDAYFNDVDFSFKANCEQDLDCKLPPHDCPPEEFVDFPVDYLARDFDSFRRALLEFAALRYPRWQDRLAADVGIMLVELMSALGDEFSYKQDRISRETHLETATQRRSQRQHARLVDYPVHEGRGATIWIEVQVQTGAAGALPAGMDIWARSDRGDQIEYEIGRGLADILPDADGNRLSFEVDAAINRLLPHIWDEDDVCLPVGTTTLALAGHHTAVLDFDDPPEVRDGKWVLLRTDPSDASKPARRWPVRLMQVQNEYDPVTVQPITTITWEAAQALPFELDLTDLTVRGNLIPATLGKTYSQQFQIGLPTGASDPRTLPAPPPPLAVERAGPNGSLAARFTLPGSDAEPLVWLGEQSVTARPEIHLAEAEWTGAVWNEDETWHWQRSLLGVKSSLPDSPDFTLEDGRWGRVVGYQRLGQEIVHQDYQDDRSFTIRFGDGEFGRIPPRGTVFQVTYRLGDGQDGNVSADSLTHFMGPEGLIASVTNPLPVTEAQAPESIEQVRQLAPDAFREVTFRAVQPADYSEAVERLDWVQRAGTTFRWTGSWLTAFTTPDPKGAVTLTATQQRELDEQLDRFRQVGQDAYGLPPRYADLDLQITLCVAPDAYPAEVKQAVIAALTGPQGFFNPDNFTFGTPLRRSRLEAALQAVPGVRAVKQIDMRRRGWFDWRPFSEWVLLVAADEVIRVENDRRFPDRGSVQIFTEGGA
ncbi:hypothetical protein [Halomicronema sp. CCY15110]|uniref:hypothetical protein n=1 Tax=Halomicronema sp. CCY15110 TaxID=2767773 RepID=UPI0019500730|nr:hypothetical protein [Halomicronema sp. CCY15110]